MLFKIKKLRLFFMYRHIPQYQHFTFYNIGLEMYKTYQFNVERPPATLTTGGKQLLSLQAVHKHETQQI